MGKGHPQWELNENEMTLPSSGHRGVRSSLLAGPVLERGLPSEGAPSPLLSESWGEIMF